MTIIKFKKKLPILIVSSMLSVGVLTGCNDNGGPATPASVSVSGLISDGPVAGGAVTATDANGVVVGSAITSANGTYTLTITGNAVVPLTVTITGGIDIVTGEAPSIALTTVITKEVSTIDSSTVNISPFTTLAIAIIEATGQPVTASSLAAAATVVKNTLGFGLPDDFDIFATPTATNTADFLKASEALAETIRRSGTTTEDVIASLAADLTDGIIDGKASFGTTSATDFSKFQTNAATVGSESLSNTLQVSKTDGTSVDGNAALEAALKLVTPGTDTTIATVPVTAQVKQQVSVALTTAISLSGDIGGHLASLQSDVDALTTGVASNLPALTAEASNSLGEAEDNAAVLATALKASFEATSNASFVLADNTVTIQDYNVAGDKLPTTDVTTTTANSTLTVSTTTFNGENAAKLTGATPTGKVPMVMFNVTAPKISGNSILTILLKDGSDATKTEGQRQLMVRLPVSWTADTIGFATTSGDSTVEYFTGSSATKVTTTINNAALNVFTFDNQAQQMQLAITKLFTADPALSTALEGMGVNGNYFYQIDLGIFPLIDSNTVKNKITTIQGTFSVD